MMNIPIIGLVENMAYFKCPDCDKEYNIFGETYIEEISQKYNIPILARLPLDPKIAAACDYGSIEFFKGDLPNNIPEILEKWR